MENKTTTKTPVRRDAAATSVSVPQKRPAPAKVIKSPVKIKYDAKATKVWVASPDQHAGAAQELAFTQENGYISVVLPSLEYWTMLVIE